LRPGTGGARHHDSTVPSAATAGVCASGVQHGPPYYDACAWKPSMGPQEEFETREEQHGTGCPGSPESEGPCCSKRNANCLSLYVERGESCSIG
ncbi:hypothetical protein V491_02369, partial [Pseudogymnoascus sp. VKM F-3775]